MAELLVEFIQGIHINLAEDNFLNPEESNMIILDDLMSMSAKDSNVNDLFTEGSHHRNLSVITINQNLYHNKDPTQRRNCHYLVLFNNPIDRQQIMTLARQMYPEKTQYFMSRFDKATAIPHGHLVVDLKPRTTPDMRLRINPNMIDIRRPIYANTLNPNGINITKDRPSPHLPMTAPRHNTSTMDQLPAPHTSCDDCGLLFESFGDLVRHAKKWCPERESESDGEQASKKQKVNEKERISDNNAYASMYNTAFDNSEEDREALNEQYIGEGMTEDEARENTEESMERKIRKEFFNVYATQLGLAMDLESSPTHRGIEEDVEKLIQEGLSLPKAIRRTLRGKQHAFEDFLQNEDDVESESD